MADQISMFDAENAILDEYLKLVDTLNYHCERYYNDDEPEISDFEYDKLNQRLAQIEKEHPEMIVPNSPSKRVGWKATKGVLIPHNVPMLSLQDVFAKEDVYNFVNSMREALGEDTEFLVETKIDGLSMAIRYENGKMTMAVTRGDGINSGEDVTMNAAVISDVVKTMPNPVEYIEIRGEVYMTREAFDAVNAKAEAQGKKTFANPRNCAAGTLRQIDTRITKERNLSMFIFNVQEVRGTTFKTHSEGYEFLKSNGVKVIEQYYTCKTADEVWEAIQAIGNMRGELKYDIDGAVVKINNLEDRSKLGNTIKVPRWAIAYKYPPEEKETTLLDVEVGLGRTGRLTPVAVFEPISLCGTSVRRATLHNQDFIDELGLGIGDTIVVYKSGEIIPKVKGVNKDKRPANWVPYHLPDTCPSCGQKVVRDEASADYKCININCRGLLQYRIINFVSREGMDIKGFGEEYVKQLVDLDYIENVADIFTLKDKRDRLIEDKIFGLEKNTDKLLAQIEAAKEATPAQKVLAGIGIPSVGKATAKELINHFGSILTLAAATVDELKEVGDIGEVSALAIREFLDNPDNMDIINRLNEYGVKMERENTVVGDELAGLSICITGTLPNMSRDEASKLIESHGGKVASGVSKKTSYLLAGEAAGSKEKKAKDLGVKIISLEDLLAMIDNAINE